MIEYDEVGKENLVCYSEGSKFEAVPAGSRHSAHVGFEIRDPFDHERLRYYVLVNVDETNHVFMIQKDISTFSVVTFYVEIHGM